MISRVQAFCRTETGAVTVDWVVLAAATVGLGVASALAVRNGTGALADDINASLSGASVAQLGEVGGQPWPGAGQTNGICPGRAALEDSFDALVAGGETFADIATNGNIASFDESAFGEFLDYAEVNGFSSDEFVVSYDWWQNNTGPGNPASREFAARVFACTLEAAPAGFWDSRGGSIAGNLVSEFGFVLPPA